MIKEIKGQLTAGKGNIGIVVSRFNEFVTGRLLAGISTACRDTVWLMSRLRSYGFRAFAR